MKNTKLVQCSFCKKTFGCINFYHSLCSLCDECIFKDVYGCHNQADIEKMEKLLFECDSCSLMT